MTANSAVGLAEKSFRHTSVLVLHAFKTHGRHTVGRGILSGRQCQKCLRHFGTNLKLCKHLAYSAVCRKSLQAAGHFADLEPGQGHAKATAADLSKAPVLQADGPTLPFDSLQWEDEPDRPVAEILECLRLIGFDFDLDNPDEVWERVRIAFSCVCAATQRMRRTAAAFSEELHATGAFSSTGSQLLQEIMEWIATADLVDWLVPELQRAIQKEIHNNLNTAAYMLLTRRSERT